MNQPPAGDGSPGVVTTLHSLTDDFQTTDNERRTNRTNLDTVLQQLSTML